MLLGAVRSSFCQSLNGAPTNSKPNVAGKNIFEARCAVCHGLDARGGEHAPDIAGAPAVRNLSDEALLNLIHNGIPQRGMPGFDGLSKEDGLSLIAQLRFLQGQSGAGAARGDRTRGKELFSGKAGCSSCHGMVRREHSSAADLAGYGQDHRARETREAILNRAGRSEGGATAVAEDGRKFTGTIRNEDNASIQLQDAEGRFYLLMKSSLVSIDRRPGAAVHIDYAQRLTSAEIEDLVSYVLHSTDSDHASSAADDEDDN